MNHLVRVVVDRSKEKSFLIMLEESPCHQENETKSWAPMKPGIQDPKRSHPSCLPGCCAEGDCDVTREPSQTQKPKPKRRWETGKKGHS